MRGIALAALAAAVVTLVIAWPVVVSPRTTILGREIVGRQPDPFVAMQRFAGLPAEDAGRQPLTDFAGSILARVAGPVAAYNLLVLFSFPLTAAAAYALARYLWGSHVAALVAALAFAFAPVHLAHASYHVEMAQTEWIPLYLLALFAAIDRPAGWRLGALATAALGLWLATDYGALIAAVITPVALPAYWFARNPARKWQPLVIPAVTLLAVAALTLTVHHLYVTPDTAAAEAVKYPAGDLIQFGARWWSYVVPPVGHPVLGEFARDVVRNAGAVRGTLELQLSLTISLTLLALFAAATTIKPRALTTVERTVLAIVVVGAWAIVASLAPKAAGCTFDSLQPACLGYRIAPIFRAYARIGVVASLAVSLLAAAAIATLTAWPSTVSRTSLIRGALAVVLAAAVFELFPVPGTRDVLPTAAHRALASRADAVQVMDCTKWTQADAMLPWLMGKPLHLLDPPIEGCDELHLPEKLAALGYTHLIVRSAQPAPWPGDAAPSGLSLERTFPDSRLYDVSAPAAPVVLLEATGFSNWEGRGDRWRWMGQDGAWSIVNTTGRVWNGTMELDVASFAGPRHLVADVDGQRAAALEIGVNRRLYSIGPLTLAPGSHTVHFASVEPAARPVDLVDSSNDRRLLAVSFYSWDWAALPGR